MIGIRLVFSGLLLAAVPAPPERPEPAPSLSSASIDEALRRQWKTEKIRPAPLCDDATFLRRASLDITGTLPPPDVAYAFIHDVRPGKRGAAVDSLLATRKYTDYWTGYWDALLIGRATRAQFLDRASFQAWMYRAFEKNTPWNKVVADLVSASGKNSPGEMPRIKNLGVSRMDKARADELLASDPSVNGAVNWIIKYGQLPQDLAGATSKTFLGVQIQCAQCHDHKTEKWTQGDFRSFASAFSHTKFDVLDKERKPGEVKRVEVGDAQRVVFPGARQEELKPFLNAPPKGLDGTSLGGDAGTRKALADWITSPRNPWFAPAIVNRMWAHFLGGGLLEPFDDLPADLSKLPPLLTALGGEFAANGYDLKRLIRAICLSQAYQRAALKQGKEGGRLWSAHPLRPLRPEVLMDALIQATNVDALLQDHAAERRDQIKTQIIQQFVFLFDVDEEHEQRSFEGTIPQALLLLNSRLTNDGTSVIPGAALAQVLHQPGDDATRIQNLYLRALSREPTADELKRCLAFLAVPRSAQANLPETRAAKDRDGMGPIARLAVRTGARDAREQAFEDIFWALLNSSEFNLNH